MVHSVVTDKSSVSNSPRIRFAHVGPLFKEGEDDACVPMKPVTHPVSQDKELHDPQKAGRTSLFLRVSVPPW